MKLPFREESSQRNIKKILRILLALIIISSATITLVSYIHQKDRYEIQEINNLREIPEKIQINHALQPLTTQLYRTLRNIYDIFYSVDEQYRCWDTKFSSLLNLHPGHISPWLQHQISLYLSARDSITEKDKRNYSFESFSDTFVNSDLALYHGTYFNLPLDSYGTRTALTKVTNFQKLLQKTQNLLKQGLQHDYSHIDPLFTPCVIAIKNTLTEAITPLNAAKNILKNIKQKIQDK